MTNLLTKIKNTIKADLNEVLERKENQNPITLLNQFLHECEQETEKVKKLVDRQYQLKDEFERELVEAAELAEKRKHQSEIASKAGETELYQFASAEYQHYSDRAERLRVSLNHILRQLEELEGKYEEMKRKLKDMYIRRMELMGRENITRANHQINKVLDSTSNSDKPYSRFQAIEGYLDRLEDQVNRAFHSSSIDAKIAQLENEMKMSEGKLHS
ncbi:PspA/IM30 family protein [Cytobacillus solani]|uniref:Modulator protein n=1 Tax=Cytobacillus solani TaxID=1637975 RepID=A0A0Q3QIN0_9BACI|nr:PspA/IM30 family protein [Cytobacillus solani]KOP77702.1 modulator protein [Bacillus sp. FJAT-21945]KQL17502.1 modulator protein [Cytobacillus solani]USK55360.1 PspA/IM30 family protein [Cytobacillus solani]